MIRYDDQPHPHFHIIANRVADNGDTVGDGHKYSRSETLLRELEQKHELTPVLRLEKRQRLTNVPTHEQARIRLRETVQTCVRRAKRFASSRTGTDSMGASWPVHYPWVV